MTRRERFLAGMDAVLRFRHLLEQHGPRRAIFEQVRTPLEERNLLVKSGTIVDATIVNRSRSRIRARVEHLFNVVKHL